MSLAKIDLQAIRVALHNQITAALTGTYVDANLADNSTVPNIPVLPAATDYVVYFDTSGDQGLTDVNLVLRIDPGSSATIDAQVALDDYLGIGTPRSIVSAVFADRTLGGVVQDCVVLRADWDETTLTAHMPVQIVAKKGG